MSHVMYHLVYDDTFCRELITLDLSFCISLTLDQYELNLLIFPNAATQNSMENGSIVYRYIHFINF
jgi:hypothetical protein